MKKILFLFSFLFSFYVYSQNTPDFTKGIFIVNEDWFGHTNGSVNFLGTDGNLHYNVYQSANNQATLGTTTAYGTIYGDNFFLISKQAGVGTNAGERLVVANAKTLQKKAGFNNIGGDGRTFTGVDENTGYIGTSNGIYLFDIKNLTVGNLIEGTNGNQIGNMIRTSRYVFAVKQGTGVLVIDPATHTLKHTLTGSFNTITQSKDGNVWIGAGAKLIKVNPLTFETEEISLSGTTIAGTWGAWNAGGFCSSTLNNVLYWTNSGSWGGGSTISKYDIDTGTLNTLFYQVPGQEGSYKQQFYGAALRIDPLTDNLVITTTESGYGSHYEQNWIHLVNNQGTLINTYKLNTYYWFPALPVFPNSSPVQKQGLSSSPIVLTKGDEPLKIDLKDKASDADNLAVAIVKSLKEIDNTGIVSASIDDQENLVITPLTTGTAVIQIQFNSKGKIRTHDLTLNVTSSLGTEEITPARTLAVYPNPFTDSFFIEADKPQTLSVYSVTGAKVHEEVIQRGKNQIRIPHLSQGIYLIHANNQTYKVIKK